MLVLHAIYNCFRKYPYLILSNLLVLTLKNSLSVWEYLPHMHTWCPLRPERVLETVALKLLMIVYPIPVLRKSSKCSSPLCYSYSPSSYCLTIQLLIIMCTQHYKSLHVQNVWWYDFLIYKIYTYEFKFSTI